MIRIEGYNTVHYGTLYILDGTEVVGRDLAWVLRVGHKPNGGARAPEPREQILPEGAYARLVVRVSTHGLVGIRFQASGIICNINGGNIAQLREPYSCGSSWTHSTEEEAINSLIPEGFPRKIQRQMPSYNLTYGETWQEAVAKAETDSPSWATNDWWQKCKEVVLQKSLKSL